jgi:hypothetical protein
MIRLGVENISKPCQRLSIRYNSKKGCVDRFDSIFDTTIQLEIGVRLCIETGSTLRMEILPTQKLHRVNIRDYKSK